MLTGGLSMENMSTRVTLILGLREQMFQTAHQLMIENTCANLYWNPSEIVGVMVRTKIWPPSVTLTLGLPKQMFQMAHVPVMQTKWVKLFWNPSTIVELMVLTNSDGRTDRCTYTKLSLWQLCLTLCRRQNKCWLRTENCLWEVRKNFGKRRKCWFLSQDH